MKDQTYLINRVTTANGPQLVAILYEELVGALREAINLIKEDNKPGAEGYIVKGRDILAELLSTLEGSGEITISLRSLYLFVNRLMTEAVNETDTTKLEAAVKILTPLYEGWSQLGEEVSVNSTLHQGTRVTGYTYGKNQLNDYIVDDENKWKKG